MSAAELGAGFAVKKTMLYAAISIVISALICLAAAVVFSAGAPVKLIGPIGWVICGVSGFVGGLMSAKTIRKKCVLTGMLCGLFVFAILFLAGLLFGDGVMFSKLVIKLAICLFSGALGGFFGAGNKRRRSRTR